MFKMSNVSINLKKDEVLIKIDDNAVQRKIVSELTKKLRDLKKMYQDEKTPIRVTGKVLTNKELEEIKKVIKKEIDVEVTFDTPTTLGLHSITRSFKRDVGKSETTFHRGSLRSGQKLEVEGSVVVIGDVNSGAEVIAADNIAVIGNLRGLAHAGAKGNKDAIIAAGTLDVVQLRISNIVKEIDRDEEGVRAHAFIYVDEDKIVIE
jgi:septum site-determining protein MinC